MYCGKLCQIMLVLLAFGLFATCEKSESLSNTESDFQNITTTDETGAILQDDPDDWQPRIEVVAVVPDTIVVDSVITVLNHPIYKDSLMAHPAYPNPFNQIILFEFTTSQLSTATIEILDKVDHVIRKIEVGKYLAPGRHSCIWDGRDDSGGMVRAGIYRAVITVCTERNNYSIYGDIEKL